MISNTSRINDNNSNSRNEYDLYFYYGSTVFVGLLTLSVYYWKKRDNDKNDITDDSGCQGKRIVKSSVEHAKGYTMLGVLRNSGASNSPNYILQMTRDVYKNQNMLVYRLPLPIPGGVYVVGDIEMAIQILKDPLTDKSITYKPINTMLGVSENIFTSSNFLSTKEKKSGATICHWKSIRKATATSFSSTEIKRMKDIVQYHAEQWCVKTKEKMSRQQQEEMKSSIIIDPVQEMIQITFNIICEAALEYKATDNDFQEFTRNHQVAFRELFIKNCINPFRALYGYIVSSEVRKAHYCCKQLQRLAHKILVAYKNNPNKSTQNTVIKAITSIPNLPIKEQIGEVLVFLIAGHDTTGLSIANTLCLLGQNQQIQTKLLNEVKANNVQDQPLEWSKHVQYFTCIVKETHRYMPVTALGSSRCIGKEYIVSNTGTDDTTADTITSTTKSGSTTNKKETTIIHQHYIPKGATIFLPQIIYTRNEQIFPNADTYNPDRWMITMQEYDSSTNDNITISREEKNNEEKEQANDDIEKVQRLQNLSIIPFATGSRNCVGQALATTEIDIVLPIILSKFHIAIKERGYEDFFSTWKFTNSRLLLTERN